MGIQYDNKPRYLYELIDKHNFRPTQYYVTFENKIYAKGSSRNCYKGIIKDKDGKKAKPDLFQDENCLVKIYQNKYNFSDFESDLENYFYSKNISSIFNYENNNNKIPEMNYKNSYAISLKKHATDSSFDPFDIIKNNNKEINENNEWNIIEPFIEGNFQKFINNDCKEKYITDKNIVFFLHWNWAYSKGEKIICDIQGVKKNDNYELTDPAVQSINKEYGDLDLGPSALINFVFTHKHNEFCKDLPWPNEEDMKKIKKLMLITNQTLEKQLYKEVIDSTFSINTDNNLIIYFIFVIIIIIILSFANFFCIKNCKNKKSKMQDISLEIEKEVKLA